METVFSMSHEQLRMSLGYDYIYPITKAEDYRLIHNMALERGIRIIAMFHDGIVYQLVTAFDEA